MDDRDFSNMEHAEIVKTVRAWLEDCCLTRGEIIGVLETILEELVEDQEYADNAQALWDLSMQDNSEEFDGEE